MMGEFLVPLKRAGRTSVDYGEVAKNTALVKAEGSLHNKIKWSIF